MLQNQQIIVTCAGETAICIYFMNHYISKLVLQLDFHIDDKFENR